MDQPTIDDDRYFRILDSYARFYNSQTTAHVGYLISTSALLIASTVGVVSSIVLRDGSFWPTAMGDYLIRFGIPIGVVILVLLWVKLEHFPIAYLSLQYQLGRIQYYTCLSGIVWEHMGAKSDLKKDYAVKLMKRAPNASMAIEQAMATLFEARLYLSGCSRQRDDMGIDEGAETRAQEDYNLKEYFAIDSKILDSRRPYVRRVLSYDLSRLLYLAYEKQIEEFCSLPGKKESESSEKMRMRGVLLKQAFDC